MDAIDEIRERTLAAIVAAADPGQLDAVRVAAIGKKRRCHRVDENPWRS